jgi:pilus assembly protein Flp/PilA
MNKLTAKIMAFVREEEGLTMVEYAVAGAVIVAGAAAGFASLGDTVSNKITEIETYVNP